jgi:uncharacterized protein (TIGR00290 family)
MATPSRTKALLSWSSGKDSAYALDETRRLGRVDVVGLITTVTTPFGRVSMHGVREALLDRQIEQLGLPCRKIGIPSPCPNSVYEREMLRVLTDAKDEGISHVVFGDLFLQDIRAYREEKLSAVGFTGVFPLWGRDTRVLAREMLDAGLSAVVTCVDPRKLDPSFAGRTFDARFLADLPAGVDPCGENGEFHTFVTRGPMFPQPIHVSVGAVVERDGFVFADVVPSV